MIFYRKYTCHVNNKLVEERGEIQALQTRKGVLIRSDRNIRRPEGVYGETRHDVHIQTHTKKHGKRKH